MAMVMENWRSRSSLHSDRLGALLNITKIVQNLSKPIGINLVTAIQPSNLPRRSQCSRPTSRRTGSRTRISKSQKRKKKQERPKRKNWQKSADWPMRS